MTRVMALLMLVWLSSGTLRAQGEEEYDAIARKGIDQVYNLEFEKADVQFHELVRMRPHDPAGHFFLAMVTWWRILINIDDQRYDDGFFTALDQVIAMCDSLLDQNPNDMRAVFFKGGAIGFEGRLRFHRDDYLAAANAGRKALPIVQLASELDPGNNDILLGSGIYNYYAEVIPHEYPYLKPLMLFVPPGDRAKGLLQLRTAAEKGRYASTESAYFLMQIYYYYEKDYPSALALALNLHKRFDGNMLFHKYVGRCYASLTNWQETAAVFADIAQRSRAGKRGYAGPNTEREAEYYQGLSWMNLGDPQAALQHFYRCDELCRILDKKEPSGFMAITNLKIGMIYEQLGKRDLAIAQYRKVLDMKEYKDSHDQAETYLKALEQR